MHYLRVLLLPVLLASFSCIPPPLPHGTTRYAHVLSFSSPFQAHAGSAVPILTGKGKTLLATAAHVLEDGLLVKVKYQGQYHTALPVITNKEADLALLLVHTTLPVAQIAQEFPGPGSPVYGVGPSPLEGHALVHGIVSAAPSLCPVGNTECAVLSLPSGPGFSGGPVFNGKHQLIGIILGYTKALPHLTLISTGHEVRRLVERLLRRTREAAKE